MKYYYFLPFVYISFCLITSLSAQNGSISGKIIDKNSAESIISATVILDDGNLGTVTDFDGQYIIRGVAPGKHTIKISYIGYTEKSVEEIMVQSGEVSLVDIVIEEATTALSEIVVTAVAKRESMSALTVLQKNSTTISDGISAETIRRSPDRTTSDVIRRVSGASIQDNKFAVIRGLNDRYNMAMLNGTLLSSTEPDRKAFSFDIFPSNLIDQLVILKTANADLPGEFAGGAILIKTKDIPEENYLQLNISTAYNTSTSFKPYLTSQNSKTDWLGYDNGSRSLSKSFPDTETFQRLSKENKYEPSKLFANDWGFSTKESARPNLGFQLSSGIVNTISENVHMGTTFAISYNNSNRLQNAKRFDYATAETLYEYNDKQFKNNILWGALINTGIKLGTNHKIGLQACYSTNTDNIVNERDGSDFEQVRYIKATAIEFTENHLLTTQLSGDHSISDGLFKFHWSGGYNSSIRNVPSLRRMFYSKNFDAEETENFRAFVPFGSADPYRSGRFYSDLNEDAYHFNADVSLPFTLFSQKQSFKVGVSYLQKERNFDARVLGYVRANLATFNQSLLEKPQDQIFDVANINNTGFIMDEITNPSDQYYAGSVLPSAFFLFDQKIGKRLKLSWGIRYESYRQKLQSIDYTGTPIDIDQITPEFLPSLNTTFQLNEIHQLRFSLSKTLTRPEFREIAPFAFYDFYLNAGIIGSPGLVAGNIYNADIRYEMYPGQNQLFSISAFYKKFINPIEFTFSSLGAGTRTFSYQNIPSSQNFGIEIECRKHFGFITESLTDLVVFTNVAFIKSDLDLSNVSAYDESRALQGQSPYIVNAGASYSIPEIGLSSTLVYNIIADRIAQVGTVGYADVYEKHRNLLDFQISKKISKDGEIKLNVSDILMQDFTFYQDIDKNHQYNDDADQIMQLMNNGTTVSVSFGWKF
ncbi:MAG: carboxypeptidase-like regulatory domain-containing protein [Bacteroidota bacterium]|nr:carboxypeptidase-like regulatory domain-containing protein [Bacteroidota bacterium]